jgi:hypothetical protein
MLEVTVSVVESREGGGFHLVQGSGCGVLLMWKHDEGGQRVTLAGRICRVWNMAKLSNSASFS